VLTHEGRDCEAERRFLSNEIVERARSACYRAGVLLRPGFRELALCVIALVSGPASLALWNQGMGNGGFATPVGGDKWFATRPGFFNADGFRAPELSPTGSIFNWTEDGATLRFDRLKRSAPATVALRIQGGQEDSAAVAEVVLSVDGVESERLPIPRAPRRISIDLPPRAGRGASVSIRVEGAAGVMVENVRLRATSGSLPVPREAHGALAFAALATYLAARVGGAGPFFALLAALFEAAVVGWLSISGGAFLGRYSENIAWIALVLLVLSILTPVIRDLRWRRAWIVVLWLTALKLTALSHPQIKDGDATFHADNLGRVLNGEWYITSATPPPAIAFPYPQGLSAAALPFSGAPRDQWVTLLRTVVLIAEVGAGFAFSVMVASLSTPAVGAVTFALLALAPEGLVVLFIGNLANQFADALMILGCAFLMAKRPILGGLSLLGAFLSHLGAVLVGAPLAFLLALALAQGEAWSARWRRATPVLLALVAAFVLYYRRFADVVLAAFERMTALEGAAAAGPMTAPVTDKLARMSGGQDWWITAVLFVAATIGMLTWPRDRKPLSRVVLTWGGVMGAFTVIGLVSPLVLRSGLSARPVIAALCASGLCALWARGGSTRVVAGVLVALMAIGDGALALDFFP